MRRFLAHLSQRTTAGHPLSSYTLHGYIQVVKGFFNWCEREGLLEKNHVARAEQVRWQAVSVRVATWRRPTAPLWIISGALLLGTTVVAAWLSGDVTAPRWFHPINDFWWRLWP